MYKNKKLQLYNRYIFLWHYNITYYIITIFTYCYNIFFVNINYFKKVTKGIYPPGSHPGFAAFRSCWRHCIWFKARQHCLETRNATRRPYLFYFHVKKPLIYVWPLSVCRWTLARCSCRRRWTRPNHESCQSLNVWRTDSGPATSASWTRERSTYRIYTTTV